MKRNTISPHKLKLNPNNPRTIKDANFKKLVQSIKEFPEMLEIRPIVVNAEMVVLGGNMRLRACKEAGLKEVPYIIVDDLTEEKQREFVIKDNVSGGDWDWEILANEWDAMELNEWGLDVPIFTEEEQEIDLSDLEEKIDTYLNNTIRQIVLYYDADTHKEVIAKFESVSEDYALNKDNSAVALKLLEFYEQNRNKA